MLATHNNRAIAILMLSSSMILCTPTTSHADALKPEKIYFSKESIDQLKNWINSNKSIRKEIKIGNFNIPLPPGEWKPLPGGSDSPAFLLDEKQIGLGLYIETNNKEQIPDYMLNITASQSIPFTYLPQMCDKNDIKIPENDLTISNNKTIPNLDCNTFEARSAFNATMLGFIQLYSKENNNITITYIRAINKNDSSTENFKNKEKTETETFKNSSNNYLKILNKNLGPLFK